jgi:osmotically-inducible protein OsmY
MRLRNGGDAPSPVGDMRLLNETGGLMKSQLATSFVVLGLALAPAAVYAEGKTSDRHTAAQTTDRVKENVSDAAITAKVKAELAKDKQVSALRINVDTDRKGVVTLKGKAKNQAEADRAAEIAKSVNGVTEVKNNIQIAAATTR